MLTVRQAHPSDIGIIAGIFNSARKFMAASGNATQWIDGYPTSEIVLQDIANGNCYIVMQERRLPEYSHSLSDVSPTMTILTAAGLTINLTGQSIDWPLQV